LRSWDGQGLIASASRHAHGDDDQANQQPDEHADSDQQKSAHEVWAAQATVRDRSADRRRPAAVESAVEHTPISSRHRAFARPVIEQTSPSNDMPPTAHCDGRAARTISPVRQRRLRIRSTPTVLASSQARQTTSCRCLGGVAAAAPAGASFEREQTRLDREAEEEVDASSHSLLGSGRDRPSVRTGPGRFEFVVLFHFLKGLKM
jgi:hypothetical protein